jgi:serine/threonine protein kinase
MAPRTRDYQPGDRIPGTVYEVNRLIGAGGMGTVYDVEDTTIGKRYVLKTLHSQLGDREDLARRMQNESRALARLNHTNIVEVITAGVTGDALRLPYYVMERLNGQSLRMVLEKRGQLELPHAYHIAIDLLDALDHAHDKGVIHRDVKPDNIFLHSTSAGVTVTKLLDFGILSLLDSTQRETEGRFLGTLRYAAPEQLRGEKATPKVDVYAAALVLYEMVCGRGPFDDEEDPQNVGAAHLHKEPPPLSRFAAIPSELDALVSAALSKLPVQRPRDAFSFAASLRNLKKALSGSSAKESTENRATAAALVGGEPAASPMVHVQRPSPGGPYIISPVAAPPPGTQPTSAPYTTMRGMALPSMGPSLAQPLAFAPTATSAHSVDLPVDRDAATNSFVPDAFPRPQQQTGSIRAPALAAAPTLPSSAPIPAASVAFRWPPEQPTTRSDEPHVRTLSAPAPVPSRPAAPVVAGVVLMTALAVTSAVLVVVRPHTSSSRSAANPPPATMAAPTVLAPGLPAPQPVVTLPAPTLALPALDDPPAPLAPPQASAATLSTRETRGPVVATGTQPVLPAARPTATAARAVAATVRPGPGF